MNNDFMTGFEKTAGITSMGKIKKVIGLVKKTVSPTQFPKATYHPATVNIAKKMKGKEQLMEGMRKRVGNKKMDEIIKMKRDKDIANYKAKAPAAKAPKAPAPKAPAPKAPASGQYQGTTHDYAKYRKEFKAKALASKF